MLATKKLFPNKSQEYTSNYNNEYHQINQNQQQTDLISVAVKNYGSLYCLSF